MTSSCGNQSSIQPPSLLNSQSQNESQLTESQIEERIFRKYKKFQEELENKTKQGFNDREEVIRRSEQKLKEIKREKEYLQKKLRDSETKKVETEQHSTDL